MHYRFDHQWRLKDMNEMQNDAPIYVNTDTDTHPVIAVLTPYRHLGKRRRTEYLRRALAHVFNEHGMPVASHQILAESAILTAGEEADDDLGLKAQRALIESSNHVRAFVDYGISPGMTDGIEYAKSIGREVVLETIGQD
jgi:hypothetical protein